MIYRIDRLVSAHSGITLHLLWRFRNGPWQLLLPQPKSMCKKYGTV